MKNVYNNQHLACDVTRNDVTLSFTLGNIVGKRNKPEINQDHHYDVLNSYLDYKGDEFKDKLFKLYTEANDSILDSMLVTDDIVLPTAIVHNILDILDAVDIERYLTDVYKLYVPNSVDRDIPDDIEKDGRVTRVQTYSRKDYLELAALVLITKATLPIIGEYAYIKSEELNTALKEYILFEFYSGHNIVNNPAMVKLFGFGKMIIEQEAKVENVDAIRVIEKFISRDQVPTFLLANVLFNKVAMETLIDSSDDNLLVKKVYTFITGKIKIQIGSANAIKEKKALPDVDGSEGDRESFIESYRVLSEPVGYAVELNWYLSDIDRIVRDLGVSFSPKLLLDAKLAASKFITHDIGDYHIYILSVIFKRVINPKAINYMDIDSIINIVTVGFAYLWTGKYYNLAILLLAAPVTDNSNNIVINTTANKNRLSKELKDALTVIYPYERVINDDKTVNVVEESINTLVNNMYELLWVPIVSNKYIDACNLANKGNSNRYISRDRLLTSDLKLLIAEFIIENESILFGKEK